MPAPFLPLLGSVPDPRRCWEEVGGTGEGTVLTLTAYSWLVMRLIQVCTRAWAPSPSTSSCSW